MSRQLLYTVLLAAALFLAPARAGDAASKNIFSASAYAEHVKYLASDELGGRRPGQPGIQLAADYIAGIFKAAGCEPAGDDGTFFQEFEVTDGRRIHEDEALLEIDGRVLKLHTDWVPTPFNRNESAEGRLAFAGYGIEAPDFDYNDFDGFDPKDKILLVLRYEPRAKDPKAEFGGDEKSRHSLFSTKAKKAYDKGARAILVVDPVLPESNGELYPFKRSEVQTMDVPIAHITRDVAEELLRKAGLTDLKTLQEKLENDRKPLSADMNMSVRFVPAVKPNKIKTHNVAGLLRGDGSSDEIIVVGAHYDHLGNSTRQFMANDEKIYIHNGADDNASGTAGVCELARAFGAGPKLRRNILFMTFSAEEMGLLGSAHFVNHPTVDLAKVRAMYNMDMIGRYGQRKFEIYGVDTAEEFDELVNGITKRHGIEYKFMSRNSGVFGQSDHASFYRKDIPILFPFTGIHRQYHQPEDDWELIDPQGATVVLQLSYDIIRELASMKEGPTFIKKERKSDKVAGDKDKADDAASVEKKEKSGDKDDVSVAAGEESKEASDGKSDPSGASKPTSGVDAKPSEAPGIRARPTARLGIMPGYAESDEPGMLVEGVIESGAAEKAGIKEGDRILQIGEVRVANVQDYMKAIEGYKPGDTAEVTVTRDKKEMKFKVTFTGGGRSRRERS